MIVLSRSRKMALRCCMIRDPYPGLRARGECLVDKAAKDVHGEFVHLLDSCDGSSVNNEGNIHELRHFATVLTAKADRSNAALFCGCNGANDVFRIAACAEDEQNIAFAANG